MNATERKAAVARSRKLMPTLPMHFCACNHVDYIHGDKGKGPCDGVVTRYDGYTRLADCPCSQFVKVGAL